MKRPLQFSWHNVDPTEGVMEEVRLEVARLERFWDRITGCTVTLEAPSRHHRQSGAKYRVRIALSVPGGKLVVGRDPPQGSSHADLYAAVKAAFREVQRQLEDHLHRLDGRVKTHAAMAAGTVARLMPADGYGFLRAADGREIYFHENSVLHGGFRRLEVGTRVHFVEEAGDEGPQASTVRVSPRSRRMAAAARSEIAP